MDSDTPEFPNPCTTCRDMLVEPEKRLWNGTFDLRFKHHANAEALKQSSDANCCICKVIGDRIIKEGSPRTLTAKGKTLLEASLGRPARSDSKAGGSDAYQLDFSFSSSEHVGSFGLKALTQPDASSSSKSTIADSTGSDEVIALVRKWLERCKCRLPCSPDKAEDSYPSRLINLKHLKDRERVYLVTQNEHEKVSRGWKRKLAEAVHIGGRSTSSSESGKLVGPYATLSHRWNKPEAIMLTQEKTKSFQKKGISVSKLPPVFKDAMDFAYRLGVFYIWIDALCIIQGTDEKSRRDWTKESRRMREVYNGAYFNISATATREDSPGTAKDGPRGLYRTRPTARWWEGTVPVNTKGAWVLGLADDKHETPKTYAVHDLEFWDRQINKAELNSRGWVLQERLLAPRVIHFCDDQVAWECAELDATECFPEGLPYRRLTTAGAPEMGKLKDLNAERHGKELRQIRVPQEHDPDLKTFGIFAFELWRRIVEVYSRTDLSFMSDKLVAIAGISRLMQDKIDGRYYAGLWEPYLASQLTWRVEPAFVRPNESSPSHDEQARQLQYLSSRSTKGYVAPSFSWACISSPHGIHYGEVTAQERLVKAECEVTPGDGFNQYGQLEDAKLKLEGVIKKVELSRREQVAKKVQLDGRERLTRGIYTCTLTDMLSKCQQLHVQEGGQGDDEPKLRTQDLPCENIYLDSPSTDLKSETGPWTAYAVPVGDDYDRYLECLLLVPHTNDTFQRIGLMRIPSYLPNMGHMLKKKHSGVEGCCKVAGCTWEAGSKTHKFYVV